MEVLRKVLKEEQKDGLRSASSDREKWNMAKRFFTVAEQEKLFAAFKTLENKSFNEREQFLESFTLNLDDHSEPAQGITGM
jgi:hypothetical protein